MVREEIKLKINKGSKLFNRTRCYLAPAFLSTVKLPISPAAFFIGDEHSEIEVPHMIVVLDMKGQKQTEKLKDNKLFICDYPLDVFDNNDNHHIFVFGIQTELIQSWKAFLQGKYSAMFPKIQMEQFYKNINKMPKDHQPLFNRAVDTMLKQRREDFEEEVNNIGEGTTDRRTRIIIGDASEQDFPINYQDEVLTLNSKMLQSQKLITLFNCA
jgi:hypothetical protein